MSNASLGPREAHLAAGALEVAHAAKQASTLQDDLVLSRPVEALLTDVVIRLRESWVAGPAKCWGGIHPISELAVTDGDKRVAAALCEGFFQFSQFLCGLEFLLLQRVQGTAEFEQTLLGVEKLFVHGHNYFFRLGRIAEAERILAQINGSVDGADGSSDDRKVHEGSPNVEKGCVRTPDSTLRGNHGGEGA